MALVRLFPAVLLAVTAVAAMAAGPGRRTEAAAQANNIGVAFMSQQLPGKALAKFEEAQRDDPAATVPLINQGIALIYLRRLPEAEQTLLAATRKDPRNARVWYCLGLARLDAGNPAGALAAFERAEALEPRDADAHYYVGTTELALRQYEPAVRAFEKALDLNPLHASAQYGLARALQRGGRPDEAKRRFLRFQQITQRKIGTVFSDNYGEQGRLATAEDMLAPPAAAPMIPVTFRANETGPGRSQGAAGACILDIPGTGETDLVALRSGTTALQAYRVSGVGSPAAIDVESAGLLVQGNGVSCAVGDYDNDGRPDLAVATEDRVLLFHNLGGGRFSDQTARLGLHPLNRPRGLTFVDFDHDGDLDLLVTGSPSAPGAAANTLWRNNGNSTFTDWTAQAGFSGGLATDSAILSDINNDRAVDLILAGQPGPPSIYQNQREGPFRRTALYAAGRVPGSRGVTTLDFNHDAWMDVAVTHAEAPGLSLWKNLGTGFERVPLPMRGVRAAWGLATLDFDNDGWIDLAVLAETSQGERIRVLRNCGPGGFRDVSSQLKLDALDVSGARSLIAADLDGDGAADLVVARGGQAPLLLHNVGGSRNHSLRLSLAGLADNRMALGTKIEVLAAGTRQKFEVAGASGYLSQGPNVQIVGLGPLSKVDVVRLLWPTGVPQDEVDVAAGRPLALKELDRRGSSCPVLFAWDGTRFRFISDMIGAAVVGHWISPASTNNSDPDEWIRVPGSVLRPHDGRFSLRLGEPMEEVNYIDRIRLVAVDHPRGTDVYPDERFLEQQPFATGAPVLMDAEAHLPVAAEDPEGHDLLPLLARADHRYVQDFAKLSYAGFAERHDIQLDLGPWSPDRPLRLFLTGYVEYFSASSMYAAWQAGLRPEPPALDAQLADGTWKTVLPDMGFPAGLPRTIVVDLSGRLSAGTRRIRIRTNLQVYWDQILVDNGPDVPRRIRVSEVPLASARLAYRGYPKQIEGAAPGDLTYDYEQISSNGPFFWPRGSYTRFGSVTELLQAADDRAAIFGSGEEIDAEFDANALETPPAGSVRDYFFYASGFVKDMDFYEAMPFTVAQLPFRGMSSYPYPGSEHFPDGAGSIEYQLEWNDRFESGDRVQPSRFDYESVAPSP